MRPLSFLSLVVFLVSGPSLVVGAPPDSTAAVAGRSQVDREPVQAAKPQAAKAPTVKKASQPTKSKATAKPKPAQAGAAKPKAAQAKPAKAKPAKPQSAKAQPAKSKAASRGIDPAWLSSLKWRQIGPTSMGGRIVDLAVVESDPCVFWVASASGGLFKTANAGVTFEPQFQHAGSISIGDVCVAPSDPKTVWVGTGEHNGRNSISWGDGVYKSTDGGKTWQHKGLKKSFQIGRMVIHPTNPDIVYVGALGRLWGENKERGVYKTADGGDTWTQVLHVDDKTGCIDVEMHPRDPDTLIAAMYERKRDAFDGGNPVKRWGPGSGLYKTTNGGRTWTKLSKGLPSVRMGRIGLSWSRSNPLNVFAIIETERSGQAPKGTAQPAYMGIQGSAAGGARLEAVTPGGPTDKAGLRTGDEIIEIGGKKISSYADIIAQIRAHKSGDTVQVKARRGKKTVTVKLTYGSRQSGRAFSGRLGGQVQNIQNRQGDDGFETGGVFKSADGGESWKRVNSLTPRPFYYSQIRVDPSNDRYVYVLGIRLYGSSNGGRQFNSSAGRTLHPDHHAMWINPMDGRHIIVGCDGGLNITHDRTQRWEFLNNLAIGQFYDVGVDHSKPYRIYGGMQDNGSWGGPSRTRSSYGPLASDWYAVGGGDGFVCRVDPTDNNVVYYESQYGNMQRVNLKTGDRARIRPAPQRGRRYRFNWKTPFALSHHNPRIYYCAGNYVFKSLNQGSNLRAISPKITTTDQGTATALAESPLNSDVIYVGTDDGNLWGTRDGGRNWNKLEISGLAGKRRVNSIEPSRYKSGRCYVVLDGHFYDSDEPEVWVTENLGKTWQSLRSNLPDGCTRVLREDVVNENLLYLGSEFGIYASLDRGRKWVRLNNNLPHVAIHEIAVHPTDGEIVAGTHGRSLWILDVAALRQFTREVANAEVAFFKPAPAIQWHNLTGKRFYGVKRFIGENPPPGAALYYTLQNQAKQVRLTVTDIDGLTLAVLRGKTSPGLQKVTWNLRRILSRRNNARAGGSRQRGTSGTRRTTGKTQSQPPARPSGGSSARSRFLSRFGVRVQPGAYLATLDVDGKTYKQKLIVHADPEYQTDSLTYEEEETIRKMGKQLDD